MKATTQYTQASQDFLPQISTAHESEINESVLTSYLNDENTIYAAGTMTNGIYQVFQDEDDAYDAYRKILPTINVDSEHAMIWELRAEGEFNVIAHS